MCNCPSVVFLMCQPLPCKLCLCIRFLSSSPFCINGLSRINGTVPKVISINQNGTVPKIRLIPVSSPQKRKVNQISGMPLYQSTKITHFSNPSCLLTLSLSLSPPLSLSKLQSFSRTTRPRDKKNNNMELVKLTFQMTWGEGTINNVILSPSGTGRRTGPESSENILVNLSYPGKKLSTGNHLSTVPLGVSARSPSLV